MPSRFSNPTQSIGVPTGGGSGTPGAGAAQVALTQQANAASQRLSSQQAQVALLSAREQRAAREKEVDIQRGLSERKMDDDRVWRRMMNDQHAADVAVKQHLADTNRKNIEGNQAQVLKEWDAGQVLREQANLRSKQQTELGAVAVEGAKAALPWQKLQVEFQTKNLELTNSIKQLEADFAKAAEGPRKESLLIDLNAKKLALKGKLQDYTATVRQQQQLGIAWRQNVAAQVKRHGKIATANLFTGTVERMRKADGAKRQVLKNMVTYARGGVFTGVDLTEEQNDRFLKDPRVAEKSQAMTRALGALQDKLKDPGLWSKFGGGRLKVLQTIQEAVEADPSLKGMKDSLLTFARTGSAENAGREDWVSSRVQEWQTGQKAAWARKNGLATEKNFQDRWNEAARPVEGEPFDRAHMGSKFAEVLDSPHYFGGDGQMSELLAEVGRAADTGEVISPGALKTTGARGRLVRIYLTAQELHKKYPNNSTLTQGAGALIHALDKIDDPLDPGTKVMYNITQTLHGKNTNLILAEAMDVWNKAAAKRSGPAQKIINGLFTKLSRMDLSEEARHEANAQLAGVLANTGGTQEEMDSVFQSFRDAGYSVPGQPGQPAPPAPPAPAVPGAN